MGEVWIGCKRLILRLSKVLIVEEVEEVEEPFMHPNQRLIPIQNSIIHVIFQLTASAWAIMARRGVE
jgi:hypothetical protein